MANTNIATFRAIAKRYPGIETSRILGDLIVSTPGEEGRWFATAKTLKQYDLALALARRAPVDPKTLVRAARDHVKNQPLFALEVALMALYWMARGEGYELTGADVGAARDHAVAAAGTLGSGAHVSERIAAAWQRAGWHCCQLGAAVPGNRHRPMKWRRVPPMWGYLSITPTVDKPPTHRASLWMAHSGSVA